MSCPDRSLNPRHAALLLVLLGGAEAPVRAQESGSLPLDYQALAVLDLNYRDTARLNEGSESSGTARASADFSWLKKTTVSSLRASLRPYYEQFRADESLSTWGGSAGLGYQRRPAATWSWSGRMTLLVAPEQDVEVPQTGDTPDDPTVQALVPRNGYISTTFGGDVQMSFSESRSLSVGVSGAARRYDRFEVGQDATASTLVDERHVGLSIGYQDAVTERVGWSARGETNWFLLDDEDPTTQDTRQQASVLVGMDVNLSERSAVGGELGVSGITTNAAGDGDVVPRLNLRWTLNGEALSWQASLLQRQGIFPGSDQSANATSVACRAAWKTGANSNLNFGAGYGIAEGAGAVDAASTRTTNRLFYSGWSYGRGPLTWSASVRIQRQRSEGANALGSTLDASSFSVGAAWRLTEGRS